MVASQSAERGSEDKPLMPPVPETEISWSRRGSLSEALGA